MLQYRDIGKKSFSDYKPFLPKKRYDDILKTAKVLKGKRIIHVNTTLEGGGVAELLKSLIPLENDVGLKSEWHVIQAPSEFFIVTKKIHNALQSANIVLTENEKKLYLDINKKIARDLWALGKADVYVMHDPQPAAVIADFHAGAMISRMHIDLSNPNEDVLSFFRPYFRQYDYLVFSMKEFVIPGIQTKKSFILPAIDPFIPKNITLPEGICHKVLQDFDINPDKPLISQISRFDPWKDPLGVIQAYYYAKNDIPGLQLALVGIIEAQDDPEAIEIFEHVKKHAIGDPDIFLFSDPKALGSVSNEMLVNAVQTASDVVVQKSLKEGFGLTVTEAMWKGKAVVAGNVGGIRKQIRDGKDGFLVGTPQEAAKRIVQILKDEKLKKRLGKSAKARVRDNFLMSRHLFDHLKLYQKVLK